MPCTPPSPGATRRSRSAEDSILSSPTRVSGAATAASSSSTNCAARRAMVASWKSALRYSKLAAIPSAVSSISRVRSTFAPPGCTTTGSTSQSG